MLHYIRFVKHGDPLKETRRPRGTGTINYGYLFVKHKGKVTPQHRVIMENIIGRTLKNSEIVHHINENKLDNRPENLQIMSKSEHQRIHHTTTFRNATHKECTFCHIIKPRWQFYKRDKSFKFRDHYASKCKDCTYLCYYKNK